MLPKPTNTGNAAVDNVNGITECSLEASATGIGNRGAHLYVFQSVLGPIKIGRSNNVEKRRRALEGQHGARIKVVAMFPDRGPEEAAIHAKLAEFRMRGEWFRDDFVCRNAIRAAISHQITFSQELSLEGKRREKEAKRDTERRERQERADAAAPEFDVDKILDRSAEVWALYQEVLTARG